MTFFWLVTFIILLLIEIFTINLVTIWFALGSIAAMFCSLCTDSTFIQIAVFVGVSLVSLLLTKPIMKKMKNFDVTPTNSDMVIGKVGVVVKKIENNKYGEVKIFGNVWTARADEEIEVGEKVKVLSIEGVKLIVKKEEI